MSQNINYKMAAVDQLVSDLGQRIARIRLAHNISQEDLATRSGITRRTLSRLETGHGASLETWVRVLRGLGLEDHLQACLPDPGMQPVARQASGTGEERKRARAGKVAEQAPWFWDQDETP
jgi:putative transcriptional regulator